MSMVQKLKVAAQRRAAFNRTVREIRNMSYETAMDLGIYPGDAETIARRAVYGA